MFNIPSREVDLMPADYLNHISTSGPSHLKAIVGESSEFRHILFGACLVFCCTPCLLPSCPRRKLGQPQCLVKFHALIRQIHQGPLAALLSSSAARTCQVSRILSGLCLMYINCFCKDLTSFDGTHMYIDSVWGMTT